MRIAFLCKRHYMSKDVILDRYARLYEIPRQLAECGHQVSAFCLDYYGDEAKKSWQHETHQGMLKWHTYSLGKTKVLGLCRYPFYLLQQLKVFKPDVIIGASDIPHVVLAALLAKKLKTPYSVDLYDNFEGFGQAKIPFFKFLLKQSCRHAKLVTTTSALLKEKVQNDYAPLGSVIALASSVDTECFKPRDKQFARKKLNLPQEAILIGTAGGLLKERGIDVVYQAISHLVAENAAIYFVLAGPIDEHCKPPEHPHCLYLGMLSHNEVACLFNALDIGIIYLKDTDFGRYCFPQKAYEMMASHLPLVATKVGAMPALLNGIDKALYTENSVDSFVQAVLWQVQHKQLSLEPVISWQDFGKSFEKALLI